MSVSSLGFHDVYDESPSESGFHGPAADRYKLSRQAFNQVLAEMVLATEQPPITVTSGLPSGDAFAITVDDGGVSYYTIVADHIEAFGWRGHCFITTDTIGRTGFLDRQQIRELDARGQAL